MCTYMYVYMYRVESKGASKNGHVLAYEYTGTCTTQKNVVVHNVFIIAYVRAYIKTQRSNI